MIKISETVWTPLTGYNGYSFSASREICMTPRRKRSDVERDRRANEGLTLRFAWRLSRFSGPDLKVPPRYLKITRHLQTNAFPSFSFRIFFDVAQTRRFKTIYQPIYEVYTKDYASNFTIAEGLIPFLD